MTHEQMLAEFEAWADKKGLYSQTNCKEYIYAAWQAWQAARLAGLREAAKIADQYAAEFTEEICEQAGKRIANEIRAAAGDETDARHLQTR